MISFALQGTPSGTPDIGTIVVVALLVGAVLLVWWASRPSVIARYAAPEPAPETASSPASSAPGERDHAGY